MPCRRRCAPRHRLYRFGLTGVASLALLASPAAVGQLIAGNLADLSFEELGAIEITTVSKRAEPLAEAPAAVFVLTAEDIRRSGATSIPEALRLAPNLHVAQAHGSGYAISARGFNNPAANKLLVMIDGRSVYSPLFAGVFWDVQDVMLEDVDRIEVVSGPGGTLWGTNAVNGIINIITRPASQTQGGIAAAGAGNREGDVAARYGGAWGANGHYRIYAKHLDRRHTDTADGDHKDDAWHKTQAGFRADWQHKRDRITVQSDVYDGRMGQPLPGAITLNGVVFDLDTVSVSGLNLLTRWDRSLAGGSNLMVQAYYDRTERDVPPTFDQTLDIVDVQFQHSLAPRAGHAVTWGLQYRYGHDRTTSDTPFFAFLPTEVDHEWLSLFAQDQVSLDDDLTLTAGARLERNDYTGTEFLPNVRLAWRPAPHRTLWAAASRAVRSPSRLDRDVFVPATPPFLLPGGPQTRSEIADVLEVGYRAQVGSALSYSVTAFHTNYDRLRTQEIEPSGTSVRFDNLLNGKTHGVEMWGTYEATPQWRWNAGLRSMHKRLRLEEDSNDVNAAATVGNDPSTTWLLRSSLNPSDSVEIDATVRHVSELPQPQVPSYTAFDLRIGWEASDAVEMSVVGRNLFDRGHAEFTDVATRTEIGRAVYVKILGRF